MKKVFPVSLDEEMIEWIKEEVDKGHFRNRSHVVEFILAKHRDELLKKYDTARLRKLEQTMKEVKDEEGISSEPR